MYKRQLYGSIRRRKRCSCMQVTDIQKLLFLLHSLQFNAFITHRNTGGTPDSIYGKQKHDHRCKSKELCMKFPVMLSTVQLLHQSKQTKACHLRQIYAIQYHNQGAAPPHRILIHHKERSKTINQKTAAKQGYCQ